MSDLSGSHDILVLLMHQALTSEKRFLSLNASTTLLTCRGHGFGRKYVELAR